MWAVVPGPGQESVWDYPRPPRIEPVTAIVRVEFAGIVIAETRGAVRVLETASPPTVYLPPEDVRRDLLEPSRHRTACEWKGRASYWTIRVGDREARDGAWSYEDPTTPFRSLRGWMSFYPGRVDGCWIGEERVTPQPGRFYGGWMTANIVGPVKGEPGTLGW
ncbi:MAG: DUF427 domain-containing protein [Gemmatimonadota bacterium]|nr:DUF427 domain-containing protein [Gemmatimonadota bacterium]MDH5195698.1 DUF427 domain-containing protein [Gemmatimonadota bacterium]